MLVVFGGLRGIEAVLADPQSGISGEEAFAAVRTCLEQQETKQDSSRDSKEARRARRAVRRLAAEGGPLSLSNDKQKDKAFVLPPSVLFDAYVNTCLFQASRTIRAEEALLITLAAFRSAGIHSRETPKVTRSPTRKPHIPALLQVMDELSGH